MALPHCSKWWPHPTWLSQIISLTYFKEYIPIMAIPQYMLLRFCNQTLLCHQASPFFMMGRTHLPSILLTQPWLTRSWREMSQGRTPWWANSTILCLTTSGKGRPFTNTPPSWFTPPCPADTDSKMRKHSKSYMSTWKTVDFTRGVKMCCGLCFCPSLTWRQLPF